VERFETPSQKKEKRRFALSLILAELQMQELVEDATALKCGSVVINYNLSGSQYAKIQEHFQKMEIVDRWRDFVVCCCPTHQKSRFELTLRIFAERARTKEARLQVEKTQHTEQTYLSVLLFYFNTFSFFNCNR
jgi:50S ribosomal subunit-associated GTPase HflX